MGASSNIPIKPIAGGGLIVEGSRVPGSPPAMRSVDIFRKYNFLFQRILMLIGVMIGGSLYSQKSKNDAST